MDDQTRRANYAAVPAKLGMGLAVVAGLFLLCGLLLVKFIGRIIGLADGADDQDHLM